MTGSFSLDWSILALSLFNTVVLLWLSFTVLLNANRRNWGVWLMGLGLLAGALFFVSHTAILGQELTLNIDGLNFWWQIGWIPVTVAPFAWYVVMLWYGGYWTAPRSALYYRHAKWLVISTTLVACLILLLLTSQPIPAYDQIVRLELSGALTLGGVPVLFLAFPVFMVACILLSIDVLLRPAVAERVSDLARRRSRPWLLGSACILLMVSLLVAAFIILVVQHAAEQRSTTIDIQIIGLFDFTLALLIAVSSVLLGQAIVTYEVFTGKVLPRHSFFRHWRNIVFIAAGFSVVIGFGLAAHLRPVYSLLLTTLLMVTFYALYSWRSFVEREQFMARLRPFVSTQNLVSHLLNDGDGADARAADLLQAICRDILGTDRAQLTPLGILAPLAGAGLTYPPQSAQLVRPPANLNTAVVELETENFNGYCWAIPLWAERGLIGALLVGAKQGGGLYTQEEIDIAQAAGERLVDMLAGEQMAQALMSLQRQRVMEGRVVDMRMRRTLHDDILPTIHTGILQLSSAAQTRPDVKEAIATFTEAHQQLSELIRSSSTTLSDLSAAGGLRDTIRRMIDSEFAGVFTSVRLECDESDGKILDPLIAEVLLGAVRESIRNAAVHGRGTDTDTSLNLSVQVVFELQKGLAIYISDDGVGVEGGLNSASPGSGSGLALHSALLAAVGGSLTLQSTMQRGTQVSIILGGGDRIPS
ncbi:MAG: hypothetical protein H7175_23770 [Burkholderiales bacterium]|nr:hypothetical protein [Anaerolineae bacterium]